MTTGEVRSAGDGPLGLLAGMSLVEGRARRLLAAAAVAATIVREVRKWQAKQLEARSYQVTIDGDDEVYPDLQAWLVEQMAPSARRALRASTRSAAGPTEIVPEGGPAAPAATLRLALDARQEQVVVLAGRRVRVMQNLPEWIGQAAGVDASRFRDLMRSTFTCPDEESRDAVLDLLTRLAARHSERQSRLHVVARWGGWTRREFPGRPLDTVVLPDGQAERVSADLAAFLNQEAEYARLGVPYHRGYLFHGPPGTGKTSLARALATEHRLDVYFLPLSAIANDAALFELLAAVPDRSMLLIEDVDIAHASRSRDDGEKGVTMSGLLNALDGVATPHGLVTVLTTNSAATLDPALLRAGRTDRVEAFDTLGTAQLAGMAKRFAGLDIDPTVPPAGTVAADVVESLKETMGRGDFYRRAALQALKAR